MLECMCVEVGQMKGLLKILISIKWLSVLTFQFPFICIVLYFHLEDANQFSPFWCLVFFSHRVIFIPLPSSVTFSLLSVNLFFNIFLVLFLSCCSCLNNLPTKCQVSEIIHAWVCVNSPFSTTCFSLSLKGLVKAKKYDWKDSNLALFGSDTEKQVKSELSALICVKLIFNVWWTWCHLCMAPVMADVILYHCHKHGWYAASSKIPTWAFSSEAPDCIPMLSRAICNAFFSAEESAESEPAWQGAGQEVGLKIWRIVVSFGYRVAMRIHDPSLNALPPIHLEIPSHRLA